MRFFLPKIYHDSASFEALTYIYLQTKDLVFDEIEIDMGETSWFAADICAVFGAILHGLRRNLNTVKLNNLHDRVEKILSKNNFLLFLKMVIGRGKISKLQPRS